MKLEIGDVFGLAMWEHLNGTTNGRVEGVERDDGGFCFSGGPAAYFRPPREWPACEKKALRFARGKVLDVGCGAGRTALYLQEKGLDVLGTDLSPLAVKVCRRRGLKRARMLGIDDLSEKLGSFDTIVMFGNNFGLFASKNKGRRLLRRFHRMTSERGRIIVQTLDPYQTDDPMHLAYHRCNRGRGRMGGQARIRVRYRTWASPWFDYLLVSPDEMTEMVSGTGWEVRRFIGQDGAPIYTAVLEKTKET